MQARAEQRLESTDAGHLAAGVFVGRERELGQLRGALDAAVAGRAGVVMLAGEPGIGKTTLTEETVTYARRQGAQVLWGRCYEWEGPPAYWPWVQVIRGYADARDPQHLRSDLGRGAAAVAQVVPEVRERFPDLPELPRMEGEQARFRLFDGVAAFLRNATSRQPLLLALDDLHWADTPSLLLLQFVARELEGARLLIVGTYRDTELDRRHPLTATLAELARGHSLLRVPLRGLTAADTAQFIALSTESEPEAALVEAVQRETEGNPFFVSEVVRLLVSEGHLGPGRGAAPWSTSIPQSVRDAVGRRLNRLSPTCNDVLAIASVVGREFTHRVLERVSGLAPDTVLDALEEAAHARLIDEERAGESYRFTHALVQETLYAELSAGRRLRLHAEVGHALEHVYALDPAPHFDELAHHFAAAAPVGHAEKAVAYAIGAGERALSQLAWETAIQHFERALRAIDLCAEPNAARRCDVLLALGSAQYHMVLDMSESPAGQQAFLLAATVAQTIGSFERLARAALGYAGLNVVRTPGGLQQVRLLEEALALAPAGDSALTARLLARLAADYRVVPDRSDRIAPLSDDALTMARRLANPAVLAFVLIARRVALWNPDNLHERLALVAEARRAADAAGDLVHTMWCHILDGVDLYEVGDNAGLDRAIDAGAEVAQVMRTPYFLWATAIWQTGRMVKEGRFAEVDARVPTLGGGSEMLINAYFRTVMLFLVRREQGRLAELAEPIRAVIEMTRNQLDPFDRHRGQVVQALRVILLAETGQVDEARTRFAEFANQNFADLERDSYWLGTVALLADACAALGDRKRAALSYDLLLPYADCNATAGSGSLFFGAVSYHLGLLATLLGRRADASRHFEAALEMNARMKAIPLLARTRVAYARLLLARDSPNDQRRAADLLAQAQATADDLGLVRLSGEIAGLRERPVFARRPADGDAVARFGLSEREREVLGLMAAGCSNPEIAEALFISRATARTHVGNVLAKLGVHSRAEAVGAAHRFGLLDHPGLGAT